MTKVMGKRTLRIVLAMLVLVSILTLSACKRYDPYNDPNRPVVISDDGYFYIRLNKSNQTAIALGLTDIGKEQQVLVVPSVVQGFVVNEIGLVRQNGVMWGVSMYFPLESEQLQKLYMPHTIWNYDDRVFSTTPNLNYVISMRWELSFIRSYLGGSYTSLGMQPNIKYYYNYDESPNEDLYWRDYVVESGLYLDPDTSTRDGYIFGGWYTDSDCTQEWDNVLPTTPEELVELYARWIEQEDTK
ncbi:MAG: InlB B-repeat-containing protein [Clostridiales bacterium]|jgi:uncharacterized repeat protein (TIGR02543 family)|nr:InlB B-repeat-containing protein [Clostridiales bacterium]